MDVSGVWPVWLPGPQPMASWITRKRAASTWAARLWAFSSEKMGRLWIRAGRLVLGQKVSDSEMLRILIRKWVANSVRREESIVFGLLWYVIMVKLRQKTKLQSLSWHFPVVWICWQMRTVAKSAFRGNASIWWLFQENNRNRFWAPEHIQYIDLRTYSIIETHFGCSKSLYQLAVLGGCFRWTFCSASFIDLSRCEARWGECWDQGPWAASPRRVQSYRAALKWHTCHLFRVQWETWMSCWDQAFWRPLMCAWTIGDSPLRCRGCRWVSAAVSNRFSAAVMPFLQDLRHVWLRPARSSTPHCRLG